MAKLQLTFDTDGPQNREEICDAMKAFFLVTGREPIGVIATKDLWKTWCKWFIVPPEESAIMGMPVSIGPKFLLF